MSSHAPGHQLWWHSASAWSMDTVATPKRSSALQGVGSRRGGEGTGLQGHQTTASETTAWPFGKSKPCLHPLRLTLCLPHVQHQWRYEVMLPLRRAWEGDRGHLTETAGFPVFTRCGFLTRDLAEAAALPRPLPAPKPRSSGLGKKPTDLLVSKSIPMRMAGVPSQVLHLWEEVLETSRL